MKIQKLIWITADSGNASSLLVMNDSLINTHSRYLNMDEIKFSEIIEELEGLDLIARCHGCNDWTAFLGEKLMHLYEYFKY